MKERKRVRKMERVVTAEPIVAYRVWRIKQPTSLVLTNAALQQMADRWEQGVNPFKDLLRPYLGGVGMGVDWLLSPTRAYCNGATHAAPFNACMCGMWGLKDEKAIPQVLKAYGLYANVAYGTVELWGHWFEHSRGYRAEWAKPKQIKVVHHDKVVADQLAQFYSCEVEWVETSLRPIEQQSPGAWAASVATSMAALASNGWTTAPGAVWRTAGPGSIIQSAGGFVPPTDED